MIWECHIVHHKSHIQIDPVIYSETRVSVHIWVDGLTMWSNVYQHHSFCTWCCDWAPLGLSKPAIRGIQRLTLLLSTAVTPYISVYFDSLVYECKLHVPIKIIINGMLRSSRHHTRPDHIVAASYQKRSYDFFLSLAAREQTQIPRR